MAFATAALLIVLGALLLLRNNEVTPGPLTTAAKDSVTFSLHPNQTGSWGMTVLMNRGDTTATLDAITPVDKTPGLTIVDTLVGGPQRKYLFVGATYSWPNRQFTDLHPVAGMTVPPEQAREGRRGVNVVFVVRGAREGRYTIRRLRVTYRVGDVQHERIVGAGLGVCIRREITEKNRFCAPQR